MEALTDISLKSSDKRKETDFFSSRVKRVSLRKRPVVFLVDDDPLYLKALELAVSSQIGSLKIYSFQTAAACLNNIKQKPDIVILDYYLDAAFPHKKNGINVLREIKKYSPKTKVIMLSSQDSLNTAIECMDNGAYDYISKSHTSFNKVNELLEGIIEDAEPGSNMLKLLQWILLVMLLLIIINSLLNN